MTRRLVQLLSVATCAATLAAGCKTPSRNVPALTPQDQVATSEAAGKATLGTGDVLEVRVYGEPEMSGAFRVAGEGTIDYPYCGRLQVGGLTSNALVDLIVGCLKDRILKNPQVTVFLKEYNSKKVFVIGEVQKPGMFAFEDRMSIIHAITLAGGFTKLAAKNSVIVTRIVEGDERKIKVEAEGIAEGREKNFPLQPGDIVYVPESFL